jgi:hypothetical protein
LLEDRLGDRFLWLVTTATVGAECRLCVSDFFQRCESMRTNDVVVLFWGSLSFPDWTIFGQLAPRRNETARINLDCLIEKSMR